MRGWFVVGTAAVRYTVRMPESPEHPLARRVRTLGETLSRIAHERERGILLWAAGAFVVIFSLIGAWKLWSFGYNALDLGIYRQVATNSIHGNPFGFTIHPHSYLGDHLELFFAILFPLFALVPHGLTLVVLQAFALALAVFPLSKIAERIVGKPWHLLFALGYLANPTIQNMALFEFHLLPFAIPLVSFALLAYLDRKFWRFLIFLLLALTVREDVSLAVIGLGIFALVERRSARWSVVPLVLGASWLVLAFKLTAFFSGYSQYKFLVYYGWLGSGISEMVRTALTQPWIVVQHLFSIPNIGFLLALLLPFAYLPLLKPRWLIPIVPTILQLLLVQSAGELLVEIHYPSLLIPFFVVASAAAFRSVLTPPPRGVFSKLARERAMTTIIIVVVVLYGMVVIGPIAPALPLLAQSSAIADRVRLERAFTHTLPRGGTVAGYETIAELADRPRLYSLHYVFLGKKQFSSEPYVLPDDASIVLLDLRDFLLYQLLYRRAERDHEGGYARIRAMLAERKFVVTSYLDRFAVLERGAESTSAIELVTTQSPPRLQGTPSNHEELSLLGWSTPSGFLKAATQSGGETTFTSLPLSLTFTKTGRSPEIRPIEFLFKRSGKSVYRELMPLGGGVLPTSDWNMNETVTSNYRLLIPKRFAGQRLELSARVLDVDGEVSLNGVRSLILKYNRYRQLGPDISIGSFTP